MPMREPIHYVLLKQTPYRVGDIVTVTVDHPYPITEGASIKGKVGMIIEIETDMDEGKTYYRLNDDFVYADTEFRLSSKYEIRAALRELLKTSANLAEGLYN